MSDRGVHVKICGLREPEHAQAAIDAGADMVGMLFADVPRRATLEQARAIRDIVGPRIELLDANTDAFATAIDRAGRPLMVGVFARQSADEINRVVAAVNLDVVELSGGEHPSLTARITRPVIRTVHVAPEMSAQEVLAAAARPPQAVTLLDSKSEIGGGSGKPFDWSVAAAVARGRPIMLAGGLRPENVARAIEQVRPWGVDVSSGVESGGRKDPDKIRAFVEAAKNAAQEHATPKVGETP